MIDPGYLVATALDLSKRDNTAAWLEYWGIVVIGNHAVHIRVKVPNLLVAGILRTLVGGSLCSKGAERSGSATIEKWTEDGSSVL